MRNITLEELGELLKRIRKEKGLTQKEVAERIQVGQSIISDWEKGTRNPGFLGIYKLCQLFDMTLDELLGIEKKKYVTLIVSRDDLEKLRSALQEYEAALNFIFPDQNTTLHLKWAEHKQLIELLLLNAE
jgi:transcriptional regulator with XRE-family HTH domain